MEKDKDIIAFLNSLENKNALIKKLIRDYIKYNSN